jgi:hypothetical protein
MGKNKKRQRKKYLLFWVFLKTNFRREIPKFSPFLRNDSADRAQIFLGVLQRNRGVFFCLQDAISIKYGSLSNQNGFC